MHRRKLLIPREISDVNIRDHLLHEIGSGESVLMDPNTGNATIMGSSSGNSGGNSGVVQNRATEDYYFMLDSINRIQPYDNGVIEYDMTRLNNNETIQGAVKIKIGAFHAPNILRLPTRPQYHYYKSVYLQIAELPGSQAITIEPSKYFQFRLRVENTNSSSVRLVPEDDTFYLTKPFTDISTLTFRFIMPHDLRPMLTPRDVLTIVPVVGSTDMYEIVGDGSTQDITAHSALTTPYPIALDNELVNMVEVAAFIQNLQHPDVDFKAELNSPEGVIITTIVDDRRFTIDIAAPAPWGVSTSSRMIIAKNRICIPVRLTCARATTTNHLQAIQI